MAKKTNKKRDLVAKELWTNHLFRGRTERSVKDYSRKTKHKGRLDPYRTLTN